MREKIRAITKQIISFVTNVRLLTEISVYWFFGGCYMTLVNADFDLPIWDDLFFVWEAVLILLVFTIIVNLIPNDLKAMVIITIIYASIRFLWITTIAATGIESKYPIITSILKWAFLIGGTALLWKDLKKRCKQKS